jgi:hypothetical protein
MTQDTETQILVELRSIREQLDQVTADGERFAVDRAADNERFAADRAADNERFAADRAADNERFKEYRQATQWVVQLAFGLIASATIITIVGTIFNR